MPTLSISLSPQEAERIEQAVRSGDYASDSEVMRAALHLWERQQDLAQAERARLKQAYDEGKSSGAATVVSKADVLRGARSRLAGRG